MNVDIPIDTKRLVRISFYPSKIDLDFLAWLSMKYQTIFDQTYIHKNLPASIHLHTIYIDLLLDHLTFVQVSMGLLWVPSGKLCHNELENHHF